MTTQPLAAVTDSPNPPDEAVDGSQPEPVEEKVLPTPTPEYKGLQRQLNKRDTELKRARDELAELKARPTAYNPEQDAIIRGLIDAQKRADPTVGAQLEAGYITWRAQQEQARVATEQAERTARTETERIQAENEAELRELAVSFGVDPDSTLVDYGSDDEPLSARIRKVRESAKAAARPAEPVVPAKPTVAQTHSSQPGRSAAQSAPRMVNQAMVTAAVRAYAKTPTSANLEAYRKLQEEFEKQTLA